MHQPYQVPENLQDLVDAYLDGTLDEPGMVALERQLCADPAARSHFLRYARLHTDLALEARAQEAGRRALRTLGQVDAPPTRRRWWLPLSAAALVLLAVGAWGWSKQAPGEIAWLVNAQDCHWADNEAPAGGLRPGKVLQLQSGLVEIGFQTGAHIVLEGPARLELLSGNSARLHHGKLTARVPESAKGFQVVSPQGKVVDLGTEFGMAVATDGTTDVYVFTGTVDAYAADRMLNVQEKQTARLDAQGVSLQKSGAGSFVRTIVPAPQIVPRTLTLDFRKAIGGTLADALGQGTGLTHRLPGTGNDLGALDPNWRLVPGAGKLELTTTNSDINTQYLLRHGEYFGIRLADLGFSGKEDFAITVVVPNIPALQTVGQFGLYAGARSDKNIRGGLVSKKEPDQYKQFLVQNNGGNDTEPHFVGLVAPGDDLRMTLHREGAKYSLTVENRTTGNSTILSIRQPKFLEEERDFYVGFFGANTQSDERRTLTLKEFRVTVWTRP